MLAEQLELLEGSVARIDDHVVLVVDHSLEVAGGQVEHQPDPGRHALEEPDVRDGYGELDVPHALAADTGESNLDTATVADDTPMFDPFVLTAGALPILDRTEDPFAEESPFLWLERPVVDGLRILDLALGPRADVLGGGHLDGHVIDLIDLVQTEQLASGFP